MRPPIEFLFPPELGAELIYSFVIVVCSLMIYYATKEMYELSSYKGIKYFRQSFLFFAVAYFFRYFIIFLLTLFNIDDFLGLSIRQVYPFSLFVFLYSSTMAVFYLVYSVMWKRWNNNKLNLILFNFFALVLALLGILFGGMEMSLFLNVLFFFSVSFILLVAYIESKNKHKGKSLLAFYFLLFIFFFLNIIDVMTPMFLQFFKLAVYLASILTFMIILYRVLKNIGN